jgi:hypothetical protein
MQPDTPAPISAEQVAWLTHQVSIIVGSRDARHRPHLMRAVGCRVTPDRCRVTVLLPRARSAEVLADLRDNRQVAVVFSEPASNRTLQLKGSDASVTDPGSDDEALARRYLGGFSAHIGALGLPAEVAHTILGHDDGLVAVHFGIAAAFEQTPGPSAGRRLQP